MGKLDDIWIFHTGRARISRKRIEAGSPGESCWLPILCFVAVHSEHGPVLIDAGFGLSMLARRKRLAGRALARLGRVTFEPGMDCRSRIGQCGLDPRDVREALLTHMHIDHTGGIMDLPHTRFHVSRRELDHAGGQKGLNGLLSGYLAADYGDATHLSPFEFGAADDLQPFDAHFDLFGDGSIRAVPTPGHSPGHVSVLLRMSDDREVLIAGDAAFTHQQISGEVDLGVMPRRFADNLDQAEQTLHQLRAFTRRRNLVDILPSHDPELGDDAGVDPIRWVP